jgi:hypothetical protein
MKLVEMVNGVDSKKALSEFIAALADDCAADPEAWENVTLHQYLLALTGWLEASDGYYRNFGLPVPQTPSWKTIAEMLIAARVYE